MNPLGTSVVFTTIASAFLPNPSLEKAAMVGFASLITTLALRTLYKAYCRYSDIPNETKKWNELSFPVVVLSFGAGFFASLSLQKKFLSRDYSHKLAHDLQKACPTPLEMMVCKGIAEVTLYLYNQLRRYW